MKLHVRVTLMIANNFNYQFVVEFSLGKKNIKLDNFNGQLNI